MKKSMFLALSLSLSLSALASMTTVQAATSQGTSNAVQAIDVFNAPIQMHNLQVSQGHKSLVRFSNVTTNGSSLQLAGSTVLGKTDIPFSLSGSLTREKYTGDIEAGLTDSTGNFNVVRFTIAYSGISWTGIPVSRGHQFRKLLDPHSNNFWTLLPKSLGQATC